MSDSIPTAIGVNLESSGYVKFVAGPPPQVPALPIASFNLYSAPSASGPWAQVAGQAFSEISAYVNLYDLSPFYGHTTYYAATAIRSDGTESSMSTALAITPLSS